MAAPIWNSRILTRPPVVHLPVTSVLGDNATIKQYEAVVTDMITELQLLQLLEKEVWFCQRLVHKYQNSARHMKWFRETKMICKSAQRLLQLKLPDIAVGLSPVHEGDSTSVSKSSRWPTCQMLQFCLVRLVGFAGLCQYIWSMGYKTNDLLLQNMNLQILFYRHLCKMSVISRMQIICQHLLEKCCEWYTALSPWLQCLPKLESEWLPEGVSLPRRVEDILGSKLDELRNIASKSKKSAASGQKSTTLQKVFGSDPELLPRFVLEEDVTTKSAKKLTIEPDHQQMDMSLDDIFGGLVSDKTNTQVKNHTDGHESQKERKVTSLSTDSSAQVEEPIADTLNHKKRGQHLLTEDIGVPITMSIGQSSQKKAKKRKREANWDDEIPHQANTRGVEETVRMQLFKNKHLHPPEKSLEDFDQVKKFTDLPAKKKSKKKKKKRHSNDGSTYQMHTAEATASVPNKPGPEGDVQAPRQQDPSYPTSSLSSMENKPGFNFNTPSHQLAGKKRKKRRKNKS